MFCSYLITISRSILHISIIAFSPPVLPATQPTWLTREVVCRPSTIYKPYYKVTPSTNFALQSYARMHACAWGDAEADPAANLQHITELFNLTMAVINCIQQY